MKGSAIRTDTFDDRHKLPITAINILNGFLVAIHQNLDLTADTQLNTL